MHKKNLHLGENVGYKMHKKENIYPFRQKEFYDNTSYYFILLL